MRTLTIDEMSSVSGGFASGNDTLEEVVITASMPKPPQIYAQTFDRGYGSSWAPSGGGGGGGGGGWLDAGGGGLQEVVVTAPLMTDQEKLAYDAAKARAEANLFLAETAIVGGSVAYALGASNAVQILLSVLGFHAENKYTAEERAAVLERMTEMEFEMDGMDGSHDGFVYYQSPFFVVP